MNIIYPAVFHKEEKAYWCEFPDLPGCHSTGKDINEVFSNASEALEGYILTILQEGKKLPKESSIEDIKTDCGSFINLVSVQVADSGRKIKKTLTIPFWLDRRARMLNLNFSQILQDALLQAVLRASR